MLRRRHKYNAVRTIVDGKAFPSRAEAGHFGELKLRERAGEIRNLKLQPSFSIDIAGHHICRYRADFAYEELSKVRLGDGTTKIWRPVVVDVKGIVTDVYRIKARLMLAVLGIEVREVRR